MVNSTMAALPDKVGYPALSELMASPGLSTFKRFAALNARNLLYMQAELLVLERELEEHVRRDEGTNPDPTDQNADPASRLYATSVEKLMESKDEGNGLQWDHILLIRSKLEAYSKRHSAWVPISMHRLITTKIERLSSKQTLLR